MFKYLKEKGLKRALQVIWIYKIELFLEKILLVFFKHKPLKDIIMIESHNDFDCNGGAFYDYLIKHKYNKKYKIVWLVRKNYHKKLPKNVTTVPLYRPSFRKAYYYCNYKYMTFDCEGGRKTRAEQKLVYCSHGAGGLKNVRGKILIPDDVDYILTQSKQYSTIQASQWSIKDSDKRMVYIGYPSHDILFQKTHELDKITSTQYNKVILWMPTFRKGISYKRNDSTKEQKFGLPLIDSVDDYNKINDTLNNKNILLIIKIHPKQDLSSMNLPDLSNICILTGDDVKKLNIDNYRLMPCVDALISDYSGAAYDFLQLNRPLGYVLDDMKEYKNGFVVNDIHKLIAGKEIYSIKDLLCFINDISNNKDPYKKKRESIRDYIYNHHDDKSSERLVKLLRL